MPNAQNTKAIARELGLATREVTTAARDLNIDMTFHKNGYWKITDRNTAKQFVAHLDELNS